MIMLDSLKLGPN